VDFIVDDAVDVSATLVVDLLEGVDVNDKGGVHVHGAVNRLVRPRKGRAPIAFLSGKTVQILRPDQSKSTSPHIDT